MGTNQSLLYKSLSDGDRAILRGGGVVTLFQRGGRIVTYPGVHAGRSLGGGAHGEGVGESKGKDDEGGGMTRNGGRLIW